MGAAKAYVSAKVLKCDSWKINFTDEKEFEAAKAREEQKEQSKEQSCTLDLKEHTFKHLKVRALQLFIFLLTMMDHTCARIKTHILFDSLFQEDDVSLSYKLDRNLKSV